jgi:hypothetical protein
LAVPASAAGEPDGPKLAFVGARPIKAKFEGTSAAFGVTVRNDSDFGGDLAVRLVLNQGNDVPVNSQGVDVNVNGATVKVTLSGGPSARVPPRDAARIMLRLDAQPLPPQALAGVLVISADSSARVTALTVPISIALPKTKTPEPFAKAKVKPASVTLIVRRKWPSFWHHSNADRDLVADPSSVSVEGVASDARISATVRQVDVAGDTGGRGRLEATIPAIPAKATSTTLSVQAKEIAQRGTYETTIELDETAEKSSGLTVKVITGDQWYWPLAALALGALVAYWLTIRGEMVRPKRVLQLALTRAQARNNANRDALDKAAGTDGKTAETKASGTAGEATGAEESKPTVPYELDGLFPDRWDCNAPSKPDALKLFCAIEDASRQEELDALATDVADIEARVNAWPSVCAKADALKKAADELPKQAHARAIRTASVALITPAEADTPSDATTTNAYMQALDDQVKAVREWLSADALLAEGLRLFSKCGDDAPAEHDPARWRPDLNAAKSLQDLQRCQIVRGLCRDVHVLRALVLDRQPDIRARMAAPSRSVAGERLDAGERDVLEYVSIEAPPPALPGPELTKHLVAAIGASDKWTFVITTAVVALAYLVGIYSDTWGSVVDYLTAFAAGAGVTFATNWKLLPWYSRYSPPSSAA